MNSFGYRRTASTGSDPGDPGGPNSVNHVYEPEFDELNANGIAATPGNIFIWNDENLLGISDPTPEELVPGRRIDVEFDTPVEAGLDALAVPTLRAVAEALPAPEGSTISAADFDLRRRSADSFDVDRGEHYLDVSVQLAVPPGTTYDDLVATFSDPSALAPGSGPLIAAEASFFNDGEWEVSDGRQTAEGEWRRGVLLLDRYEGTLQILDVDDVVTLGVILRLDSIAPPLAPPTE